MEVYLLKLNKLTPTLNSTMLKLVEEAGELAREVRYQNIDGICDELLDVAQTTATFFFCLKDEYHLTDKEIEECMENHARKLHQKQYKPQGECCIVDDKMILPKLNGIGATIPSTCLQIMEEAGELAQICGKFTGASGEDKKKDRSEIKRLLLGGLLDVSQTCVTMLYILKERYNIDVQSAMEAHKAKMVEHGYL